MLITSTGSIFQSGLNNCRPEADDQADKLRLDFRSYRRDNKYHQDDNSYQNKKQKAYPVPSYDNTFFSPASFEFRAERQVYKYAYDVEQNHQYFLLFHEMSI